MIELKEIHPELGNVFLMECSCESRKVSECSCEPRKFFIDLDKELPGYNPKTGIVRCPRCGDEMHKESILLKKENVAISEQSRNAWNDHNPDTGEKIDG